MPDNRVWKVLYLGIIVTWCPWWGGGGEGGNPPQEQSSAMGGWIHLTKKLHLSTWVSSVCCHNHCRLVEGHRSPLIWQLVVNSSHRDGELVYSVHLTLTANCHGEGSVASGGSDSLLTTGLGLTILASLLILTSGEVVFFSAHDVEWSGSRELWVHRACQCQYEYPVPDRETGEGRLPVPVTCMRYNSLLWMCTLNTLTSPDLYEDFISLLGLWQRCCYEGAFSPSVTTMSSWICLGVKPSRPR